MSIPPNRVVIKFIKLTKKGEIFVYYYQRIKDLREDQDLTQVQIGQILHMSQKQYSRYERGEREVPVHIVVELCRFYNVSADYVLGLTKTPYPLPKA